MIDPPSSPRSDGLEARRRAPRPRPRGGLAALLLFALTLGSAREAHAGGLFLTDRGVRPMSRGFAYVAGADDPHALWYNPAGLRASGQQLLIDANLTLFAGAFSRIDGGGNALPTVSLEHPILPIPTLAYSDDFGLERVTFGFGLMAPNAVLMDWPSGIDADGNRCEAGAAGCGPAPQRYSLVTLDGSMLVQLALAAAYEPIEGLAIGLGAHLLVGTFQSDVVLSSCDRVVCTQPE
ncbi:MAG: hypothetical protein OEY14_12775, partial [Myxococcales bacterium]|nr:hypothetical protein [Myxococcales bacterium]